MTRDYISTNGFIQDISNLSFEKSKRIYKNVIRGKPKIHFRYCSKNIFYTKLINGETILRNYLLYSESKGSVFCVPCLLFGAGSVSSTVEFSDWKRANKRISSHENSLVHKNNILTMKNRRSTLERIDTNLIIQHEKETNYWRNVLRRVVVVVKALSSRGMAFRGDSEKIGSPKNGNFLMSLELISKFDPFLASHFEKFGNKGKGSTSYLSFQTYEQIITLMSDTVLQTIVKEIQTAKYFSIIVDSTPDVSHVDQLSFVIRYVDGKGFPQERFLGFLGNTGHKSEQLCDAVLNTLVLYQLNTDNLRGQSYDNASNMSGAYSGLQTRIKKICQFAEYAPCAAHSLNLIGTSAASSCLEACNFFDLLQSMFNFFSASTSRWELLKTTTTIKNLSQTRWSARNDACISIKKNWHDIIEALEKLIEDNTQKPIARCEAKGLLRKLNSLQSSFLVIFWSDILERFNMTSKKLQSINIDIFTVVELYESLIHYLKAIRNRKSFDKYEDLAKENSHISIYDESENRKKKRKLHSDETNSNDTTFTKKEDLYINTYIVVIDTLLLELKRRKAAYDIILKKFSFFFNIEQLSSIELQKSAEILQKSYPKDLDTSFINEVIQFQGHLKNVTIDAPKTISEMLQFVKCKDLISVYPYIEIALRIFLSIPATNCTSERTFSVLKRIKSYLRSSMTQDRCSALAILCIESDITSTLEFDEVINSFANLRSRKKCF